MSRYVLFFFAAFHLLLATAASILGPAGGMEGWHRAYILAAAFLAGCYFALSLFIERLSGASSGDVKQDRIHDPWASSGSGSPGEDEA